MTNFIRTPDLEIGYEADGPAGGPAIVAVHGWPDDVGCFAGVVPPLTAEGYRVYRPYLRGHGWFTDAEFDRAADAFDNDDWPEVTVSAYLHRWGERPGDPAYADIERRLADVPPVQVPTVVLHGARDADNLPSTSAGKEDLFPAGLRRVELPGVGHFVPREAPDRTAGEIMRHAASLMSRA